MLASFQKLRRSLWVSILQWSAGLAAVALLALVGIAEWVAHRPSPVRTSVTMTEVKAEDARLEQMGLVLRDGSFLKEHPFQSPWTSHSLLIPSTWAEPGIKALLGSRHVRADLLLADLDVLQPVMTRAYGGWDSAVARGWNWDRWFAAWRSRLAAKGNSEISLNEAFTSMDQLLAFQRDNHTQIPQNRDTSDGSQTAVLTHTPTAVCTEIRASGRVFSIDVTDAGQNVRSAKLWTRQAQSFQDVSYIAVPSSYGVPQTVRCQPRLDCVVQPVGERRGELSSILRELGRKVFGDTRPTIERIGDGVVYARLPTFYSANYNGISRSGWALREPSDRVLIVDLRNNGGGDMNYGFDVLKGWVDRDRMTPLNSFGIQINSSCLYAALKWYYPDHSGKAVLQGLLDRMAQPYPIGCPRSVDTTPSRWTYLKHYFDPKPGDMRIIALVNSLSLRFRL